MESSPGDGDYWIELGHHVLHSLKEAFSARMSRQEHDDSALCVLCCEVAANHN